MSDVIADINWIRLFLLNVKFKGIKSSYPSLQYRTLPRCAPRILSIFRYGAGQYRHLAGQGDLFFCGAGRHPWYKQPFSDRSPPPTLYALYVHCALGSSGRPKFTKGEVSSFKCLILVTYRVAQIVGLSRNMTSFRIIFSESVCSTFATKSAVF